MKNIDSIWAIKDTATETFPLPLARKSHRVGHVLKMHQMDSQAEDWGLSYIHTHYCIHLQCSAALKFILTFASSEVTVIWVCVRNCVCLFMHESLFIVWEVVWDTVVSWLYHFPTFMWQIKITKGWEGWHAVQLKLRYYSWSVHCSKHLMGKSGYKDLRWFIGISINFAWQQRVFEIFL